MFKNDLVICARYCEHRMTSFRKFIENTNLIFGKVKDYFFITEFQSRGLLHGDGLLWVQNAPTFGVSKNEKIECLVHKYLTIDQTMLQLKFVI